ncbi:MAG: T3SS effector HopA1 family protein [Christensenellales bacterium]
MELLKDNNLIKLWQNYWNGDKSLYQLIIGYEEDKEITREEQNSLDDYINKFSSSKEIFLKGASPQDLVKDQECFSLAISKDFNLNNIQHRLYFNFAMEERTQFAEAFISKSREKGVPFYIKLYKGNDRRDNLVVYLTEELLASSSQILSEISSELPQLVNKNSLPLAVESCGWFGYGKEDRRYNAHSFNSRVADAVLKGFIATLNENRDMLDMECPLSTFGETLYTESKENKAMQVYSFTKDFLLYQELLNENDDFFKGYFINNSLRLARLILDKKGFGSRLDSEFSDNDNIDDDESIFEINKPNSKEFMSLTPSVIMEVLRKTCEIHFENKERENLFYQRIKENVIDYLDREDLRDLSVPSVINSPMEM